MPRAPVIEHSPRAESLRLSGVDWRDYLRLLYIFARQPGYRLTYDRGELEIMTPLFEHDDVGRFFAFLVSALADELGLPMRAGGSTTLRRRLRKRGVDPDECFWIANAARVAGKRRLDLRKDRPPDLAIEVDVSHSSLDRFFIYARLGVPELWRLEGDSLTFHVLEANGTYTTTSTSLTFPVISPAVLMKFIQLAREVVDENAVLRQFREWVRQHQQGLSASGPTDPA